MRLGTSLGDCAYYIPPNTDTLESGINVPPWINIAPGIFDNVVHNFGKSDLSFSEKMH